MRNQLIVTAAALMLSASVALGADKVFVNDFSTDPGTKPTNGKAVGETKNEAITMALPIPATAGKRFAAEFDLNIAKFNHYGKLFVGLANSKGPQKMEAVFVRLDDRIARCNFTASAAPGLDTKFKELANLNAGKFHLLINYSAAQRSVTFAVKDGAGKEIYNSGATKAAGKFNFDLFKIVVFDNGAGASEISYDPAAQAMFFRSYVGVEGEYPYVIEGTIDNLAVKTIEE